MFAFSSFLASFFIGKKDDKDIENFFAKYRPIVEKPKLDVKYKGKARSQQLAEIIRKKRMAEDIDNMLIKFSVKSVEEIADDFTKRFDSWCCLSKKRKCNAQ
ncbi:hypothetical protein BDAP_000635 [Binucleata daphniae]